MDILNLLLTFFSSVGAWFVSAYEWGLAYYNEMALIWPFREYIKLIYALLIALVVIVGVIVVLSIIIGKHKKRKIKYFVDGELIFTEKIKYRAPLNFPIVEKEGKIFIGWFTDKKFYNQYQSSTLNKKKSLKLYAKYKTIGEDRVSVVFDKDSNKRLNNGGIVNISCEIGKLYDDIRYEMLGYERATAFKNVGVTRKQVIAEMFEKDGAVNLYLALDPELMQEKGYNVTKYTEPEFAIVPCKKLVKTAMDFIEAVSLIKEAMILNNFVKSEHRRLTRVQSDEKMRKNGFAFYVKNEVIATSASDYYKLLRAEVLCYSLAPGRQIPENLDDKMILKIFKKDEQIFLYLALDADKEGLEFVGYDRNFLDTPSKFEIKVADGLVRANQLIDKLMFRYGMEKHPESAELIMDEEIKTNCGFGYRIRH